MDGAIVLLVATIATFVFTFVLIVSLRYITYRETMGLAEKGLVRPGRALNGGGKDSLRWGIVITALGLALSLGLYPIGLLPGSSFPLGIGPWMIAGFLPTFFGLGLILIYVLTRDDNDRDDKPPSETKGEPKPPQQ